jgi:2-polyprenyl-3-methyl-5-hydroxy-6-metoxy-1,4-benzoquinol methylase
MVDAAAMMTGVTASWPLDCLESLGCCPLCGATARRQLYDALEDLLFSSAPHQWTIYECKACGCAYLDPRPSRDGVHMAYETYYTHEERLDDDPAQLTGRAWNRFKQIVVRQYLRLRFGSLWSAPRNLLGAALLLRPRLRRALDGAMRHLPRPRPGQRLLDIGCGSGRFMAWARSVGWNCYGTEIDPIAARGARERGFDVHLGEPGELTPHGQVFDAVTISHVIEHVHDPRALLRSAHRLLRPQGILWIETPNIESHGHSCFRSAWRGLEPPRHLQLFTPSTLMDMLAEAGFVDIRTASWQPHWSALLPASLQLAGDEAARLRNSRAVVEGEQVGRRDPAKREFITLTARAHFDPDHAA